MKTYPLLLLFALALPAAAQQMNYQGRLTGVDGNAIAGTQATIQFSLWTQAAAGAGTMVWGKFTPTVDLIDGRFSVKLGDVNGADSTGRLLKDVFSQPLFLQMEVGSDAALPRQQILPAPTAHHAVIADTVPNGAINTAQLADGSVTAAKLNGATGVWLSSGANIYHGAGNVGIGNTNPTGYKLDVTGDIRATGTFTGSGAGLTNIDIANLAAAVKQALCPVGTILPYAGDTAPEGWLLCNGNAYYKTSYPTLAGVIGVRFGNFGYADGTVFQLPDFRGRFLRGRDGGMARDPDRASRTAMATGGATGDAVGSVQGHAFASHSHTYARSYTTADTGSGKAVTDWYGDTLENTSATGGSETRPINANVNYIIKY